MIKLLSILLLSICLYAEATFDQVQSMIDKQQYKQAVLALTVIAENHPTSSKVQYTLAQAQAGLGNLPAAKDALDRAIAINPKLDFVPAKQVEELSKTINAVRTVRKIESDSHWVLWILLVVGTSFVIAYFIRSKKPNEPATPDVKSTYTPSPEPIKPRDYDTVTTASATNKPFISRYAPIAEPVRTSRPAEVHHHHSASKSDIVTTLATAGLTAAAVSYAMNHDEPEQPTHSYQPELISSSWDDDTPSTSSIWANPTESVSSSWDNDSSSSSDSWSDSSSSSSSDSSWND